MRAAGYVLTGMRKYRRRAHPPMILAHSLTSEFFGIEEREDYFPDFESFAVWPVTARVMCRLRRCDHLAGQSCVAELACWPDPATRRLILCTRRERVRARFLAKVHVCTNAGLQTCALTESSKRASVHTSTMAERHVCT